MKMKILSTIALSVFALTACAQSYTIKGTAGEAANGKVVYLVDQNTMGAVDSCVVAAGAFSFEGSLSDQALYQVKLAKSRRNTAMVMLQPGTNAVVDITGRTGSVSDNGGLNDALVAMVNAVTEAGAALDAKAQQLQAEGKSRQEIGEIMTADMEALYDIYRNTIEQNKDNMLGAYVFYVVSRQFYPTLEEFDAASANVKYANSIAAVRTYRESLLKAENTKVGKMFVDFAGYTVDGAASKLSDYVGKGKYVLVDFWASWCGPCKGEIPNLIELQAKFGGEKFTVLGVNVWDEEPKFKEALVEEGITYPQIFIPRDNKDNATELYGIQGIPQIILFAPDGTIVQRDLRGDAMKALVEEKLK